MDKTDPGYGVKQTLLPSLSLLTSAGTLVCCALPALLVTIGAGAVLAGIVGTAPWLIALSEYKIWTFGISGAMLLIAGFALWSSRNAPCPIDPAQAMACARLRKTSNWIYLLSVLLWCVGFFFAFIAARVFY